MFFYKKKNEYNTRPEGLKEERDQARSLLNSTAKKNFHRDGDESTKSFLAAAV
jgi:hypothetical protein